MRKKWLVIRAHVVQRLVAAGLAVAATALLVHALSLAGVLPPELVGAVVAVLAAVAQFVWL